jgi:hypothetical protein
VAWYGDSPPLANDENEVYGRFLSATGVGLGVQHMRLSDMGPDGNYQYRAANPAIFISPAAYGFPTYYYVFWEGDDNIPPLVNEEFEIFYQALDAVSRLYLPLVGK